MNYLAHACLSFNEPPVVVGNMISDFVKGKQKLDYPKEIQNGIMLHRLIDTFTDEHPVTKEAKQFFKPAAGLYAGAFLDIVYDHFLALDESEHTPEQLLRFSVRTYSILEIFTGIMPEKFARMFPYMQSQNWLYNYRTTKGIEDSFGGLVRRAVYLNNSIAAFDAFLTHYNELKEYYTLFFPQVKQYALEQLRQLQNTNGKPCLISYLYTMCGIAGIVSPYPSFVQQQRLQPMADALQHRGPASEGFWINEQQTVGFAHRRLCILDLSSAADQPFHYLHYTLLFNGEIYNYVELKKELAKKGYHFSTSSDTEVIPAAFDCWGEACLHHFDGMFAFALYNNNTGTLFITRDRLGEKPFYYHPVYADRGKFQQILFASEIKALFAAGVAKNLNGTMMLNYLALGYVQNPIKKTATFYNNILSLPPGHCLQIIPLQGKIKMYKWYKPKLETITVKEEDAIAQFGKLLSASVHTRLRSDVAIGTSLSGGLDSSAIVAAIHQLKDKVTQWKNVAFTASFPGFNKDETAYSKTVANACNIHQHLVEPTADDWITNWQQLMYYQDEPVQSSSILTQYLVYKLAKEKGITVLLDGQGADEILSGYTKYVHWYLQQLLREDVSLFKKEKKALRKNEFLEQWNLKNYVAAYYPSKVQQRLQKNAFNEVKHQPDIDTEFMLRYANEDTLFKPLVRNLEDILHYNTFTFGLEELLRYADRNSMAHSREVRLPFLQHELVEFIFSLPSNMKIRDGFTKWILRKSMSHLLPENIVWRKGKIGYEPPQQQWMQSKRVQEMMMESRTKLVQQKVLNEKVLSKKWDTKGAHEKHNFDFRYLCAAAMF